MCHLPLSETFLKMEQKMRSVMVKYETMIVQKKIQHFANPPQYYPLHCLCYLCVGDFLSMRLPRVLKFKLQEI